jgi:hypothetical protein
MRKSIVPAIFLLSFAYLHGGLAWEWTSLSYQEAVWMCSTGSLQACEAMYAYDMARSGESGSRITLDGETGQRNTAD